MKNPSAKTQFGQSSDSSEAFRHLARMINYVVKANPNPNQKDATEFLNNFLEAFRILNVPSHQQLELLDIAGSKCKKDGALDSLILNKIVEMTKVMEGDAPLSAEFAGRMPIMH